MKAKKTELNRKYNLSKPKNLEEAVKILKETATTKFTSSVDLDITLNLKDKQKKESIRGSIDLPNTFGADKKVIVLCEGKDVAAAKKAGAIDAGLDELKTKILENKVEFDVLIATPSIMAKIVDLGKVLGPKGLMPNPKNGTITTDVEKAVESFKGGKTNFKMEQGQGVIRGKVAQIDMDESMIQENIEMFLKGVASEVKKFATNPFKKVVLSSTMGPGVKLDVSAII